jgi:hypothetical protein
MLGGSPIDRNRAGENLADGREPSSAEHLVTALSTHEGTPRGVLDPGQPEIGQSGPKHAVTTNDGTGEGPEEIELRSVRAALPFVEAEVANDCFLPPILVCFFETGEALGDRNGQRQALLAGHGHCGGEHERGVATAGELDEAGLTSQSRTQHVFEDLERIASRGTDDANWRDRLLNDPPEDQLGPGEAVRTGRRRLDAVLRSGRRPHDATAEEGLAAIAPCNASRTSDPKLGTRGARQGTVATKTGVTAASSANALKEDSRTDDDVHTASRG